MNPPDCSLEQMIDADPVELHELGKTYFARQEWLLAASLFRHAILLKSDFAEAYYHLGLALKKAGKPENALSAFQALNFLLPNHPGAAFQSGCLLMARGEYQSAIPHFLLMTKQYPDHPESLSNLGTCYLQLNQLNEAMSFYLKALAVLPQDVQLLFNLGVICMKRGQIREACQYYMHVVKLDPAQSGAHNNLGVMFLAEQDAEKALLHFRAALLSDPDNVAIRHQINLLNHQAPGDSSPRQYVESLFDSYADYYDEHLIYTLQYALPQTLYHFVCASVPIPEAGLDIADMGCGTGLCGEWFRQAAKSLTGVDVSSQMLKKAADRGIYDSLVHSDLIDYLKDYSSTFDLVLAGDVLVYIGKLDGLMKAVSHALRQDGWFAFSTEVSEGKDVQLSASGRFSYTRSYVEKTASQYGLSTKRVDACVLRKQFEMKVASDIYLLQKLSG